MSADNKSVILRFHEEVWNKGNYAAIDGLVGPNWTMHDANTPPMPPGPESMKMMAAGYKGAFPDMTTTVEQLLADGDYVVARWRCDGTHNGDLMGLAPTGKKVTFRGTETHRVADGKIQETWINWDLADMMKQVSA